MRANGQDLGVRSSVLVLPLLAACSHHVDLRAPDVSTAAERMASYARLRPEAIVRKGTFWRGDEARTTVAEDRLTLVLGDGVRVTHPEDLLPVVARESASAVAAERAAEHRGRARWWSAASAVACTAGAAGVLSPAYTTEDRTAVMIGGAVAIAIGVVSGIFAVEAFEAEDDETDLAFERYDAALRERLALCGAPARPCEE